MRRLTLPGAWENKDKVLVSILHTEDITITWADGFKRLLIPGDYSFLTGMPFDHARNVGVEQMLAGDYEWLFFLDSDVVPPSDAILRLRNHRQPIISGVYHRRSPPVGEPVMMKHGRWYGEYPANSIIDVEYVGAGCLLLHRSVFDGPNKLPMHRPGKPWFDWRVDMKGWMHPELCTSEDYSFCRMARDCGYRILVDTSIQCKHIGYAEAHRGSFLPLGAINVG